MSADVQEEMERFAASQLYALSDQLKCLHDLSEPLYFKNDVFSMHPYYGGECTCGNASDPGPDGIGYACTAECLTQIPNYRCGDIEIRWYKHIGRGIEVICIASMERVTKQQLALAFLKCYTSLRLRDSQFEAAPSLETNGLGQVEDPERT